VIGQPPRFALVTPRFRFRALASFAGRASIGGEREVALACLVAGRLAAAMLEPFDLTPADAKARSMCAKQWIASLSLPAGFRTALAEIPDAVASGNRARAASALSTACQRSEGNLDEASVAELRMLVTELREQSPA
jgi:hypothetical protein